MANPKVTVLMSVYNGEKYLREAIDSILNQTFKDFEFIIIDDGSTDKTAEILDSYNDPRLVIIHQGNVGLTKSLNKAIRIAKGDWIARMDADDISMPPRLVKEIEVLDKNSRVGVVSTSSLVIDKNSKVIGRILLKETDMMCHPAAMFRKTALNSVGNYRDIFRYAQDKDLWFRIQEKYRTININEPLLKLRFTVGSISFKEEKLQKKYAQMAIKCAQDRRSNRRERVAVYLKEISKMQSRQKKYENIDRKMAYYEYRCGRFLIGDNRFKESRKRFLQAIRKCPISVKYWLFFFATFLPGEYLKIVKKFVKKVKVVLKKACC